MRRLAGLLTAIFIAVGLLQSAPLTPRLLEPVRAAQTAGDSSTTDADVQTSTIGSTARALQRIMWQLPHQWEFGGAQAPDIATADNNVVEVHDITIVLSHDPDGDALRVPQDPAVVRAAFAKAKDYVARQTDNRITLSLSNIITYESPTFGCSDPKGFVRDLASATGVRQTPFHHIVAWFPNERCQLEGEAVLQAKRGNPYRVMGNVAWVGHQTFPEDVFTHEVLHLLGLFHAQSLTCTPDATAKRVSRQVYEGCRFEEYGDPFDVMGYDQNRSVSQLPQVSPAGIYFLGFRRDQFTTVQHPAEGTVQSAHLGPSHLPSEHRYLHVKANNNEHYLVAFITEDGSDWPLSRAAGGPGLAVYRLQDRPGDTTEPISITGMALLSETKGTATESMLVREGESLRLFGSDLTVRWDQSETGALVHVQSGALTSPFKESAVVQVTPAKIPSGVDANRPRKSSRQVRITPKS